MARSHSGNSSIGEMGGKCEAYYALLQNYASLTDTDERVATLEDNMRELEDSYKGSLARVMALLSESEFLLDLQCICYVG